MSATVSAPLRLLTMSPQMGDVIADVAEKCRLLRLDATASKAVRLK
jgi:hypothetical protein